MPCTEKKVFCRAFIWQLYVLPLPDNFSAAYTWCPKQVVFVIMDNQNLPRYFFPLRGELFPRPFGKKIDFGLRSNFFSFSPKNLYPILLRI